MMEAPIRPSASLWSGLLACLLACLLGCTSTEPSPPRARAVKGPVHSISTLLTPVAQDLDDVPGPDGFGVKVFAFNRASPVPVRITSGKLEILMYDGVVEPEKLQEATPLKTWVIATGQLASCEEKSPIGPSYQVLPKWGKNRPAERRITVLVRYRSPEGAVINSAPSSISVSSK